MYTKSVKEKGKYVSYILRHGATDAGLSIDKEGWVLVDDLLAASVRANQSLTREQLDSIVENNNKQRYSYSEDGLFIRANQGHSTESVDITFEPRTPPAFLYHGTTTTFVDSILQDGLKKMNRHHVHLSLSLETAIAVGSRHGQVAMLQVNSHQMHADGFLFYCSANDVWLTDHVPARYIEQVPH